MFEFEEFKREVISTYRDMLLRHELNIKLENPTPGNLRNISLKLYANGLSKEDIQVFQDFFNPTRKYDDLEMSIRRFELDKLKPLKNFIMAKTNNPDEDVVKLLAILTQFSPRPFHKWRELRQSKKIEAEQEKTNTGYKDQQVSPEKQNNSVLTIKEEFGKEDQIEKNDQEEGIAVQERYAILQLEEDNDGITDRKKDILKDHEIGKRDHQEGIDVQNGRTTYAMEENYEAAVDEKKDIVDDEGSRKSDHEEEKMERWKKIDIPFIPEQYVKNTGRTKNKEQELVWGKNLLKWPSSKINALKINVSWFTMQLRAVFQLLGVVFFLLSICTVTNLFTSNPCMCWIEVQYVAARDQNYAAPSIIRISEQDNSSHFKEIINPEVRIANDQYRAKMTKSIFIDRSPESSAIVQQEPIQTTSPYIILLYNVENQTDEQIRKDIGIINLK